MNDLLSPTNYLPAGISVHRDNFATDADGQSCIRVYLRRDDGLASMFEVPIYKTIARLRVSLFSWKEIEVTDHERISVELLERGEMYVRELVEAPK